MASTTEQLMAVHIARCWEGKISTYAQLDNLLQTRKEYAREVGRNPNHDASLLATMEIINDEICKLLAIPRNGN